ncbi:UDP-2,4-diacetamido-2,4,6-trideoxy-beta-L-altropyranose hydrolase [Rhizobacter sp. Root404]|uniref:UDP-2,4-diacetamido-2,4, 6-trideoxy-beta-L-altropyranose hydrolase n=1 Tax=Rhizobacter sp. Root404 TaxID=1736528 RepID=UPI0009E87B54|nr:UDP-2,4-diacetamido-2,4,6-trideoxy-beta-L-altropyranose hydrolase [Rhizobacter sp. Root404]
MRVAIRTDVSESIGAGHFTRCLALADLVASLGGYVRFLASHAHPVITSALATRSHELRVLDAMPGADADIDASASAAVLDTRTDWLIVDHYGLDYRWETALRDRVRRVLVIDDLADRPHSCDVLVDPGHGRDVTAYAGLVPPSANLLLGSQYAILNHTFVMHYATAPLWPARRRVHMFFGGGDASPRWLAQFCEWLLDGIAGVQVHAVGRSDRLTMNALERRYFGRLDWREHVDDMAAHMSECDVAVGAPGSATWERACVGLPAAIVASADNQVPILEDLARTRFCHFLGRAWELSAERFVMQVASFLEDAGALSEMRARGVAAVDGRGAQRVVVRLAAE